MKIVLTRVALTLAALLAPAAPLGAQTDYYNTDRGRPLRIEDATPVERLAWEIQVAPLRLERGAGGVYTWGIEPEIAHGILPRTQIEVGFPLAYVDAGAGRREIGLAGLEIALLHSLNQETRTLPSLAIAAEVMAPVGGLAGDATYTTAKGILTRTFPWARFHVNADYTFGAAPAAGAREVEASRWGAGVAVDRTFPLRAMLVGGEVFVEQPLHGDEPIETNIGTGIRYQLNPTTALDAGIGTRVSGNDRPWYVTFGASYMFGVRSLFPVARRAPSNGTAGGTR